MSMRPALAATLTLLTLGLPSAALAQFGLGPTDPVVITLAPQYPKPGSVVSISAQSGVLDVAASTMTVSVNGKSVYNGPVRTVNTTLAPVGQVTTIKVTLASGSKSYSDTISLKPGDVSLVLEPIATVPAMYPGKPLIPTAGQVRIVAAADLRPAAGTRIDPAMLSYSWAVDGKAVANVSGIGKAAAIVAAPLQYRNQTISVVVKTRDGAITGGDSVVLSSQNPTIRIYKNDPLLGILFEKALVGSYAITGAESTFFAAPYSFSLSSGPPALTWFVNGASSESGSSITLRPEGQGQGSATLSVSAAKSATFETATAALNLNFGNPSSFFGL